MNWQDAVKKTGTAFRITKDSRIVYRSRSGGGKIQHKKGHEFRKAFSYEIEGFTDWESKT